MTAGEKAYDRKPTPPSFRVVANTANRLSKLFGPNYHTTPELLIVDGTDSPNSKSPTLAGPSLYRDFCHLTTSLKVMPLMQGLVLLYYAPPQEVFSSIVGSPTSRAGWGTSF